MFRMEISEYDHIIQLFKGGGEQNRPIELSKTSRPSIRGENLANKNPYVSKGGSLSGGALCVLG